MKNALYFVIITLLLTSCKKSYNNADNGAATSLRFTPSFISTVKATETAFEDGDRVGVYLTKRDLALKGSFNAKDNKLFEYFSAGDSLAGVPNSVFYPDKTTPVAVYAYYPFAANVANALAVPFRVTDNLKSSDLCYASLPSAAPSANAQPLAFTHSLSRLSVNVDFSANDKVESVTSVTILGIVDSCYLNLANGAITNGTHTADIIGTTFILPAQVLHYGKLFRIECKMKGGTSKEFHFEPTSSPLTLQKSKKHSITLLLSASGVISLSNNQEIKDWTEVTEKGEMTEKVNNKITMLWMRPNDGYNKATSATLHIKNSYTLIVTPYIVDAVTLKGNHTAAMATFEIAINGLADLSYPFTIEKVVFNDAAAAPIGRVESIIAGTIYRTGDITIGNAIPPIQTVNIAGTEWCTTNLTGIAGQAASVWTANYPEEYGKFFKWGSTFVYDRKSDADEGGGFREGEYTRGSSTTPITQSKNYDYFGLNGTWPGDPCKQLGEQYRTPTIAQIKMLFDAGSSGWKSYQGVNGWFFGVKAAQCNDATLQDGCLFFPAAGYRDYGSGLFSGVGMHGWYWSSSVLDVNNCWFLYFDCNGDIYPENAYHRSIGLSVRCVKMPPSPGLTTVTIAGTKWLQANLTGDAGKFGDAANITVVDYPEYYGMFFKWASTFVYGRASSATEGAGFVNLNYTLGSSTQPTTQSKGYDYGSSLLNGPHVGDPCQKLGPSYKTPTQPQIVALVAAGSSGFKTYNGINGWFFGPGATGATNTTIPTGCIFLPTTGYRYCWTGTFDDQHGVGYYWASSVYDGGNGWGLYFLSSGTINSEHNFYRSFGLQVRCIQQ